MSKKSKSDLIVRTRFQNPLPPPAFPPKLLTIKTDPTRYATYDFLVPLMLERPVPMLVDAEGGMPMDQSLVPGYWESEDQGRSGSMAPDFTKQGQEMPELDDEDLALLVDPPTINQAAAGLMPSTSGANLDIIGSGRSAPGSPAGPLERRKRDVAWIKRTDINVSGQASQAGKKEAFAAQLAAQPNQEAEQTLEERIAEIESTFDTINTPLAELKHPTKSHLEAVDSYEILPDEDLWGNQFALFRFTENPMDIKRLGGSDTPMPFGQNHGIALFRPLETEQDENGAHRVAYFYPDDDETGLKFNQRRREGKDVDWDILHDTDEAVPDSAGDGEENQFGFRYIRDYDAVRREVRSEYILTLQEGSEGKGGVKVQGSARYVPLTGQSVLRKRRARKGEARNDYSDLGLEYWGGMMVSLGGKDVLPEEEVEGRKEDIELIVKDPLAPSAANTNGDSHVDNALQNGSVEGAETSQEGGGAVML